MLVCQIEPTSMPTNNIPDISSSSRIAYIPVRTVVYCASSTSYINIINETTIPDPNYVPGTVARILRFWRAEKRIPAEGKTKSERVSRRTDRAEKRTPAEGASYLSGVRTTLPKAKRAVSKKEPHKTFTESLVGLFF